MPRGYLQNSASVPRANCDPARNFVKADRYYKSVNSEDEARGGELLPELQLGRAMQVRHLINSIKTRA